MNFFKRYIKLFLCFIVCVFGMFMLLYPQKDYTMISSNTYNTRRFYTGYCSFFNNVSDREYYKGSKILFPREVTMKFKDKNIVFECAMVGRGASINEKAYYAILYNDGTLKYVKGNLIADGPITMEGTKIYKKVNEYYEGTNIDYVYITSFRNCKKSTVNLSNSQMQQILKKLDIAEQCYPYDDHFHRETGASFWGYYYNGNYYGVGNDLRSEQYVKDAYDDVYSYVESLIGTKS